MIYFDNAATTAVDPRIADTVRDILVNHWGNVSSLHHLGVEAEKHLEKSRHTIARSLGVDDKTIIFTSCGSESNNMAIHNALVRCRSEKKNVVMSPIEHSSIFNLKKHLEDRGVEVRFLPVNEVGVVHPEDLASCVDENTAIVCVMFVNNELGTIEPIQELAKKTKEINPHALFHVDGVQGYGKVEINLGNSEIDSFSCSGHKIHAPKGVGFLYIRKGMDFEPLMIGGGQEFGIRPGTENVAYIAALAQAYELMQESHRVEEIYRHAMERVDRMKGVRLNSPREGASPYIINIGVKGIKSEVILHMMEEEDMYLSAASACSKNARSHVLEAVHVPEEYIDGCLRISFQRMNTLEEVDPFFDKLEEKIEEVRAITGRR